MIAVALAVIAGVVLVTCGIVADSNHADTLSFLGVMVKTTAAQIFLAGAICTWALFAAMWLLSVGVRRSKERGMELRVLHGAAAASAVAAEFAGVGAGSEVDLGVEPEADSGAGTAAFADLGINVGGIEAEAGAEPFEPPAAEVGAGEQWAADKAAATSARPRSPDSA